MTTPAELQRLWRALARATHPDARPGAGPEPFQALADDYAAARRLLDEARPSPNPRPEFLDLVCDLTASGFPAPDRARRTNAAYRKRLELLRRLWKDRGGDPDRLLAELETLGQGGPVADRDRAAPELGARCQARGDAETARFVEALALPKGG